MAFRMKSHMLMLLCCGDDLCLLIARIFSCKGLLKQVVAEDLHIHLYYATATCYWADTTLYVVECRDMRIGGFHIGWISRRWSKCWCQDLAENTSLVQIKLALWMLLSRQKYTTSYPSIHPSIQSYKHIPVYITSFENFQKVELKKKYY